MSDSANYVRSDQDRQEYLKGQSWVFDKAVADVFQDMLPRSIPCYHTVQGLMVKMGYEVCNGLIDPVVVDLGASPGNTLKQLAEVVPKESRLIGVDKEAPMLDAAYKNFPDAEYYLSDLREFVGVRKGKRGRATAETLQLQYGLVILSLVLQFTPIETRLQVLREIYKRMEPEGAILMFEKCLGTTVWEDDLYTGLYYDFKMANGYSWDDINKKRLALENVLVPVSAGVNEGMLRNAGFQVTRLFQWCNFVLFLGVKDAD